MIFKACLIFLALSLFVLPNTAQEPAAKQKPITLEELRERGVTGQLGIPLGIPVEIVATVVSGDKLRTKVDAGRYLLRVQKVDGKPLAMSPLCNFEVPGYSDVQVANDSNSLYELKHGKKAGSLNSAKILELEQGYVGSEVKLTVYESGAFDGFPKGNPVGIQGVPFHFFSYLMVISQSN